MILAFGDLHTKKEPLRVLTVLNFLDYVIEYCKKNNIKHVVNLGDLFDRPELKSDYFVPIFRKLLELSKVAHIYSIIGNHELKNKDGDDTLVETFSSFSTFIKKSQTIEIDGIEYDFLSYTDNPSDIPNKGSVLFGHLEIEGFWFNPNKKIDDSLFQKDHFQNYELVVSGHLHHMQQEGKFSFVGSPYPTTRGEGGKKNYFAIIDKTNISFEEYTLAPDYIKIKAEQFNEGIDYSNKIVDVEISSKIENFVKLRDYLTLKGALEINPIFVKNEVEESSEHSHIDKNEGVILSAAKYLEEIKAEGIDNKKLLACFKEVLQRCGQ